VVINDLWRDLKISNSWLLERKVIENRFLGIKQNKTKRGSYGLGSQAL